MMGSPRTETTASGWRRVLSVLGRLGSALLRKLQLLANPQMAMVQRYRDPKDKHLG